MNAELIQQLRRDEGARNQLYKDSLGLWTIGVGRLLDPARGGCLSDDEIDYLLANDIRRHTDDLCAALPWTAQLDDARRGALVNMAFNLGVPGLLAFTHTLALIQAHDWPAAAKAMLSSKWATQVGARARRLALQMQTGIWQ